MNSVSACCPSISVDLAGGERDGLRDVLELEAAVSRQLGKARDWSREAAIPGATSFKPHLWDEPSHEPGTTEDSFQDLEEEMDDDEPLGDDATGGFEFVGTFFQA